MASENQRHHLSNCFITAVYSGNDLQVENSVKQLKSLCKQQAIQICLVNGIAAEVNSYEGWVK